MTYFNKLNSSKHLPLIVLIFGLLISALVVIKMTQFNTAELQANFETLTEHTVNQLKNRMQTYEYGLRGARGAIVGAGGLAITRERFHQYAETRDLAQEFPGATGYSFIQYVSPKDSARFVQGMRREGLADFTIKQSQPHSGAMYVLKYTEPEAARRKMIGMDLASDTERRKVLLATMHNGEAGLTPPLLLLSDSKQSVQGFVIYLPVYKPGMLPPPEARERAIIGWVSMPFTMDGALQEMNINGSAFALGLSDISKPAKPELFYASSEFTQTAAADLSSVITLPVYGREWQVEIKARPLFLAQHNLRHPYLAGSFVVALFTLLSGLLYFNLRNKEAQLSSEIINAMPEGMLVTDSEGRILRVNPRLEKMFAYNQNELTGQTVEILLPDQFQKSHVNTRLSYDNQPRMMGTGRELYGRRKDGSEFPVEIALGPVQFGGKTHVIAAITDITKRQHITEDMGVYRLMIESSADAFFLLDDEKACFEYINEAAVKHFGAPYEEILSWKIPDWDPNISYEKLPEHIARTKKITNTTFESVHRIKGGELVPVEISLSMIVYRGRSFHFGYFKNIANRKQTEQALIAARDEAEKANKAKSDFISSMSHELRTPMNAILGFGQLMEFDSALSTDAKDNVKEILKAGYHLLALINEVLDLAKIDSGHIDLSLEQVAVDSVVEECLALVSVLAQKRNIKINQEGLKNAVARADRIRLKQALLNLISNAIKYNREGGIVRIDVQLHGVDRLRINVTDTGNGLSKEEIAYLFQPFNRLHAENSSIEGTGIGLTITQHIVELMGGTVDIESKVGVGSTFWIELPLGSNPVTVQQKLQTSAVAESTFTTQHTVLYIEDNPANLRLVELILARRKHIHLITAHTPQLGIELALAHNPNLILLDINMPDMDGYQVLEILKKNISMQSIPVIAITANAMQRDIDQGIVAGFTEYLTKPLNVTQFNLTLDKILSSKS